MGIGAPDLVRAVGRAEGSPAAVELTVDQAWFLADALGTGAFPWALAITSPYQDEGQRGSFGAARVQELARAGITDADGGVDPSVAGWVHTVCRADRWLELRYVFTGSGNPSLLRGVVARKGPRTVVVLRSAQLITFTELEADDPAALVPSVVAGLRAKFPTSTLPAQFPAFTLPALAGAKADEQLRSGSSAHEVMDYLGVPQTARSVVQSALRSRRASVEIVACQRNEADQQSTEVGVSVVDIDEGRILVSPHRADDGTWLSTFAPGTDFAIAVAVDQLTATLPEGRWFPSARLTRDFQ